MFFLKRLLFFLFFIVVCQSAAPISTEEQVPTAEVVPFDDIFPGEQIATAVPVSSSRRSWLDRVFGCFVTPCFSGGNNLAEAVAEPSLHEAMIISVQAAQSLDSDEPDSTLQVAQVFSVQEPAPRTTNSLDDFSFLDNFLTEEERLDAYAAEIELFFGFD